MKVKAYLEITMTINPENRVAAARYTLITVNLSLTPSKELLPRNSWEELRMFRLFTDLTAWSMLKPIWNPNYSHRKLLPASSQPG